MADSSPTAPQPMSGADILVQCLLRQGVEVVFAYPGGASMPIHQSLTKVEDRLRTILPRHEQGGGFMAHGYSRTTGKAGVCFSTSGPGATNFVTCIADAKMDSIPMIAITGQVSTKVLGNDAFQETPMVEICRGITKHHYLLTRVEDVSRVVKEAFHIATSGRPGPVLIDICKDVQQNTTVPDWDPPMDLPGYRPIRKARRAELEPVVQAIRASKKPFIYAGGGVTHSSAAAELKAFTELTGIPIGLTLHGLGNFPADHYLCLQMLGMHGTVYSNEALNEADLLLALGVRFDDRVTGKLQEFAKHGKIVHVDIDKSEIHKNKVAHIPVHGDVKDTLAQLTAMLKEDANADLV
ncbi:MAG TPA: thiamine pyrophosphate-binding protein, partial [Gemmataceae bacterium]|nr:thiamine pyrophosphate-binding protein [Gemmataceae bacterium]